MSDSDAGFRGGLFQEPHENPDGQGTDEEEDDDEEVGHGPAFQWNIAKSASNRTGRNKTRMIMVPLREAKPRLGSRESGSWAPLYPWI